MTPNPEWRNAAASIAVAVLFFLFCILSLAVLDGMNGGFALAFVAFFLAVSGVAVALLYVHRARAMDAILNDPAPLARWTIPDDMAATEAGREYQDYRERNRALFLVIGGMLGACALFFLLFAGEDGILTGLVLLGFAVLLILVSRVTPCLAYRRAIRAPREVHISRTGLIWQGKVYPFRSFLVFYGGVSFREGAGGNPALLVFSFTQLAGRFLIQPFEVSVPVPPGEEEHARAIAGAPGGT